MQLRDIKVKTHSEAAPQGWSFVDNFLVRWHNNKHTHPTIWELWGNMTVPFFSHSELKGLYGSVIMSQHDHTQFSCEPNPPQDLLTNVKIYLFYVFCSYMHLSCGSLKEPYVIFSLLDFGKTKTKFLLCTDLAVSWYLELKVTFHSLCVCCSLASCSLAEPAVQSC